MSAVKLSERQEVVLRCVTGLPLELPACLFECEREINFLARRKLINLDQYDYVGPNAAGRAWLAEKDAAK